MKIEKIVLDCMYGPNLNRRKLSLAGGREVQANKLLRVWKHEKDLIHHCWFEEGRPNVTKYAGCLKELREDSGLAHSQKRNNDLSLTSLYDTEFCQQHE